MNLLKKNTGLIIRFDDIAPNMNWFYMDKCEKLLEKYNIKPVLGVISNNQDENLLKFPFEKNFWDKIRNWQKKNWEIAMHGYNHKYSFDTKKKDYFNYGGKSEFFGYSLSDQISKMNSALQVFKKNKVNIRCFFAPNHTYDLNTFEALKKVGIKEVIDGYGLIPHTKFGIKFIPQLFYKNIFFPFGVQATQIHINTWSAEDFIRFKNFIETNHKNIITYDEALSKISDNFFSKSINYLIEILLKTLRLFKPANPTP